MKEYHIYNNYLYVVYNKAQALKIELAKYYFSLSDTIKVMDMSLGIGEVLLIVVCFLFSFTRLLKVTNGFS